MFPSRLPGTEEAGTGWTEIFRHLEKKHTAEVNISAKSFSRQRNDSARDSKKKQNHGVGRVKAEEEAQCADHIVGSMVLEGKCKQRACLQKMQRGSRFQCMSVFGVLYSLWLQRGQKAEIKDMNCLSLPLFGKKPVECYEILVPANSDVREEALILNYFDQLII